MNIDASGWAAIVRLIWRQVSSPLLGAFAFFLVLGSLLPVATSGMQPLSNADMSDVTGQALFVADRIAASAISGAPAVDSNITFYRMGLDADLAMNANINRMQLGCGGVNNRIIVGCDIDLSNVGFMGLNSNTNSSGCAIGTEGTSGCASSDFILHRPYIELAILNAGTVNQQLVGFNIGSQTATGFLSLGRTYSAGQINQETGATCNNNGDVSGPGAGCQSGINALSGYVKPTLTGYVYGPCGTSLFGLCPGPGWGDYFACLSNGPTPTPGGSYGTNNCSGAPSSTPSSPITGTRITSGNTSANAFVNAGLSLTVTMTVNMAMAYVHGLGLAGVPDFDISMQRSQIAWPKYDKTGFSPTANTGWWMSMPSNVIINIPGVGPGPTAELGSIFGITTTDLNLGQAATSNCRGSTTFC